MRDPSFVPRAASLLVLKFDQQPNHNVKQEAAEIHTKTQPHNLVCVAQYGGPFSVPLTKETKRFHCQLPVKLSNHDQHLITTGSSTSLLSQHFVTSLLEIHHSINYSLLAFEFHLYSSKKIKGGS